MKLRILLFLLLCTRITFAQQTDFSILTKSTAKGMFVHIVRPDLIGRRIDLYRKATGETTFRKVATLEPITTQADLERRIIAAQSIFAPGVAPQSKDVATVWKTYQQGNDTLRRFVAGVPQLAYVFQLAYLDRDVKPGVHYLYQCQEGTRTVAHGIPTPYDGSYAFPSLASLQDTAVGPRILFRMPHTPDIPVYVTVSATRKRFTDAPKAFQSATLSTAQQQFLGTTYTSFIEIAHLTPGQYDYRLQLKNIFGETDTAIYAYSVSNVPEQNVARFTDFHIRPVADRRALRLSWQLSDPRLVQSLALYRSEQFEGPYTNIGHFNASDTATTNDIALANELYFYYFELTDVFGNKRTSIKAHAVYDGHYKPTPPVSVTATASAAGVQLRWRSVDHHTRGFYVSRRQGRDGEFRQVSAFIPATAGTGIFTDSATLDPAYTYFYTVQAESDTYDKSLSSDAVAYRPVPTATALKPPLDVHARVRQGKVYLTWEALHVDDGATVAYQVYRRQTGTNEFTVLTKVLHRQNQYIDSVGLNGVSYQYAVAASDGVGHESLKSIPVTVDLSTVFRITPERLGYERMATGIRVKWTSLDVQRVQAIKVYRAREEGKFMLLTTIKGDSQSYLDTTATKGALYSYRLVIVGKEGMEGEPTSPVLVDF